MGYDVEGYVGVGYPMGYAVSKVEVEIDWISGPKSNEGREEVEISVLSAANVRYDPSFNRTRNGFLDRSHER
jgi:hypothetical protein